MQAPYMPSSDFLKAVIAETVPLRDAPDAEDNLRRLIALTRDEDRANRDWAVLLLAQEEIDTPAVREVLLRAAGDGDEVVWAEAISGLAQRDPNIALPFVQQALAAESVIAPVLEAATLCAHPSLVADLKIWAEPSDDPYIDALAAEALAACKAAA
jgi:hypothetical protein